MRKKDQKQQIENLILEAGGLDAFVDNLEDALNDLLGNDDPNLSDMIDEEAIEIFLEHIGEYKDDAAE